MTGLIGLIGDPVEGSVSPAMHRAAFAEAGLDLEYLAERVTPDALPATFPDLVRRFRGLNVTRPLKEAILPLLDGVGTEAAAAGSVNTVVVADDGRTQGRSTDGAGFLAAVRRVVDRPVGRAVVLGSGGAARAVAMALAEDGAYVVTIGRNAAAGVRMVVHLADHGRRVRFEHSPWDAEAALAPCLAGCHLLVNATPVGGTDDPSASPLPARLELDPATTVVDLVYRPRRTALLARAAAAGCPTVEGIEMLIEQGARSFELWTGMQAPLEVMRRAAYEALDGPLHVPDAPDVAESVT
jgi:shikimate dehydrogenase